MLKLGKKEACMEVVGNRFEWNETKNEDNQEKHGFSFEAIIPMFDDPFF
jgi:uncharacterized DUF497 family protein